MSYVYFVKPVGIDGPIKIGMSRDVQKRLDQLGEWLPFPLEVLLTIEGGEALERQLQTKFAYCHSHKEWFHPSIEMLEVIEQLRAGTFDFSTLPDGKRHWSPWGVHLERLALLKLARKKPEATVPNELMAA